MVVEDRFGPDLPAGLDPALRDYSQTLASGQTSLRVPSFLPSPEDGGTTFEVPVSSQVEEALEREARRQDIPLDILLLHAVFTYYVQPRGTAG